MPHYNLIKLILERMSGFLFNQFKHPKMSIICFLNNDFMNNDPIYYLITIHLDYSIPS